MMLDLDLAALSREVKYTIDRRSGFSGGFDRIAYLLELQKAGEKKQWVCVTMDAFTADIMKIGVPTTGSRAAFQQRVTGLNVISNLRTLKQGRLGTGGNVEFWPHRYGPQNGAGIPYADAKQFDFDDTPGPLKPGYGCMQVHNHKARQTIFAINNWQAGSKADLGIGNNPEGQPDWTFAGNAERYTRKRLRVLVRPAQGPAERSPWNRSFSSGGRDTDGEFLGGSEVHHLVGHKGKLYAATGYWMDENSPFYSHGRNKQWAQILVKARKGAPWKEEYDTGDEQGVLRPEILRSMVFRRPHPDVNLLILATYRTDHDTYYVDVMVRNDATGKWIKTTPHTGPKTADPHDVSVRAMRVYTDRVTREERIFLTIGSKGVLSGVYDPRVKGWIRWRPFHPVPFSNRALSICEANRSLVIGAGDAVWRRKDGASPDYKEIHNFRDLADRPVNPAIGGIRGMTTIKNPNGAGHSLLLFWTNVGAAGARGSVYRLDPDGKGGYTRHEDVRLAPVLQQEMGVYPTFFLGAYSYFQPLRNPVTGRIEHLVGLYVQLGHGKHAYPTWNKIYKGGLYAIRDENGRYRINEVNGRHNGRDAPLTAVRAIEPSPFPGDTDVYFGGHDCAGNMSTDFAWIYRASLRAALRQSK